MPGEVKQGADSSSGVDLEGFHDDAGRPSGGGPSRRRHPLASVTHKVVKRLEPPHVREVEERFRRAACWWWAVILVFFVIMATVAFVKALQTRANSPVTVRREMRNFNYPNVAICNPLGYDVHADAWALSYKGFNRPLEVGFIRPERPPGSDPTAPLLNDNCLWISFNVLGKDADPSLVLLQDRRAIDVAESSPSVTRMHGFQIIPSTKETAAEFIRLRRGQEGMPAPVPWTSLTAANSTRHYLTWSLTTSAKRHYLGLRASRLSTTYTFDSVISAQGMGGFHQNGPNGWDFTTSGFGDTTASRFYFFGTRTQNATDVTAIKDWTPVERSRYNVMVVSFATSPWVVEYEEVDPFDIYGTLGTISGYWGITLVVFSLLFTDVAAETVRKINPIIKRVWRFFSSSPSSSSSGRAGGIADRVRSRINVPSPPPSDDGTDDDDVFVDAVDDLSVKDKVERLEAQVERLLEQLSLEKKQ